MPLEPSVAHPPGWRQVSRTALAALAAAALTIAACASDADVAAPATSVSPLSDPTDEATITANTTADTSISDAPTVNTDAPVAAEPTGVEPEGFTTALVEITKADGEVCEVCMWLADTSAERGRGLMGVTSLGTAEAMAFVWDAPVAGSFFMFQTVTPLSIAWFGVDGSLVSTADMEPCLAGNSAECERFAAGGDYVLAIEVFQGDLASIGITEGATARLLPGTESANCPLI